jgi:hypothetical protein
MKLVFSGIVAVILLGLYGYVVVTALLVVNGLATAGCATCVGIIQPRGRG